MKQDSWARWGALLAVGLWFRPAAASMAVRHDAVCLLQVMLTKTEVIAGQGCDVVGGAGSDAAAG